jgi:uncharacterized Zn ribbon protein
MNLNSEELDMSDLPNCLECGSEFTYVEGDHDIDCEIDGIGAMKLKSEFVKKV